MTVLASFNEVYFLESTSGLKTPNNRTHH